METVKMRERCAHFRSHFSAIMVASRISFILLLAVTALGAPPEQRFMWIPDGEGHLHFVDLLKEDPQPAAFNGASDVVLNLYTQNNPTSPQTILLNNIPSNFNAKNPTRFVVHGWNSAASNMDHIRKAYIATGSNYNIILVDWSRKASSVYSSAKSSALSVGKYIAEIVNNLISVKGLKLSDLHLIGHSLGAHAVGVAGNNLNGKVSEVVGLDPAAPLFGTESLANRLDATDGQLVVVIHTNAGLLGWEDPMANCDFYPNGGKSQSGCGLDAAGACSHGRSHEYFAESITSKKFIGTICTSYKEYSKGSCSGNSKSIMGEWTPSSCSGSYFLNTNSASPYAQG